MSARRTPPPVSAAVRVTTVAAVVVVALVAAVVSYSHMQEVAERAGEAWRSWMVPLSVDGLVVAASMVLLSRRRAGLPGGWLPWTALIAGVGASLAANMAAAEPTLIARLIAAWPAVAFAVAFELLLQQRRADPVRTGDLDSPDRSSRPVRRRRSSRAASCRCARCRLPRLVSVRSAGLRSSAHHFGLPSSGRPTGPTRTAGRTGPDRGPTRTGPMRTDAELATAVRELAAANGGPPSRYLLKQQLGIGSSRAARLLAELDSTPAGEPAHTGAAPTNSGQ